MPHRAIHESVESYSTGVLGGALGMLGELNWIAIVSGLLITARFIYDTVRFYYFIKEHKRKK